MRLFLLIAFSIIYFSPTAQAQEYLWPTDSGQYLSSTFGETRSAHFHAGLDIKTWGREGYRVFASRDGVLHRLLITERGYGKAIYLKHPDNTYTVYAHLQRFNDKLQALADSIRMIDYSFEMDENFKGEAIEVKQGDVIGYTGSTGIGPPHLHFEVRDSLQNPVNALTTNLRVKDDLPPIFSTLLVEPLTKESKVNGRPVSNQFRAQKSNGVYDFGEINIAGKAGFAVNVYDQANEVYNAYAVYSLSLLQKSDTLFHQELKTFDFKDEREMFLDRIAPYGSDKRGHQRLYGKEGNNNPFYLIQKPSAEITASDSTETYTIIAKDYFGNRATALVRISPDTLRRPNSPMRYHPIEKWYWHEDWASPGLINTIDLKEDIRGIKWANSQTIIRNDSTPDVQFSRVVPKQSKKIDTPNRQFSLRFKENTFFDTLSVASSYSIIDHEVHFSLQPELLAMRSDFHLSYYMSDIFESDNNYRLFRKKADKDEFSYVDSELRGKTVHGYPSELGEFIIKPDNEGPEITGLSIFKSNYGKWLATVELKDELTGINANSAQFLINGVQGIAEYDYEEELLIYYHPDFTPESLNTVEIHVEDKAGNSTSFSKNNVIPDF